MTATGAVAARWLGTGAAERAITVVWRVAPWLSVWLVTQPVMRVGRRPYRIGRLADRLDAIRDMDLTPVWLPGALRWMSALVVITAITAVVWPLRHRRWHAAVAVAPVVASVITHRAADSASITAPTWQLTAIAVAGGIAVLAALAPSRSAAG